ncbi:transcriptional repressor [Reichenbachiella agarivorans]|uniref:Transcriptional repressor n=1 Tax=Reichenbachiella agarivorans TaxID=2979464 RepID=A0ABY6CK67_9BACT|nr:transcriptional repressor [Reichenbachiella agarivorans]UXP30784.1 transcriptional repressor [Reichenbachiella agarivorans]
MDKKKMIGDLLHDNGLKKTPIRTEMLELFMNHDFALSASDIVSKMKAGHDRVTVYRALASFEEHGILHKASEDGQGVKYALCGHSCPDETHADRHAHFICDECHQTYCLEEVEVPEVEVSEDFSVNKVNYTLSGVCKECNVFSQS